MQVLDGARCTIAAENQAGPALPPLGLEVDAPSWYSDVTRHVRCCFAYLDEGEIRTGALALAQASAQVCRHRLTTRVWSLVLVFRGGEAG